MPIVTLSQTLIQLLLSNRSLFLTPRATVAIGGIFLLGWIVEAVVWTDCEIVLPNSDAASLPNWCPQSILSMLTGPPSDLMLENGLVITKDSLGWLIAVSYVVYLVSFSISWRREQIVGNDEYRGHRIELEAR